MSIKRCMLCLALLVMGALGICAEEGSVHPYPLFPCKPIAGRPGLGAPEIWPHYQAWLKAREAGNEERAGEIIKPFQSDHFLHGYPEFLPYEGSVEHVRSQQQRYVPSYPLYNQNTLVKNVILRDHPPTAGQCVPFAEPVYWTSQWDNRLATSATRDVGKVYPWRPGESIDFAVGPLQPKLMYAVRIIAAIKSEDVVRSPTVLRAEPGEGIEKQFVFRFEINDRPDGSISTYILRGRPWDQFYQVSSALWHVVDDRVFRIRATLLPESQAVLYTHNIDVHNVFAECAMRAGKTKATTYSAEQREQQRQLNRVRLAEADEEAKKLRDSAASYHAALHHDRDQRAYRDNPETLLAAIDADPVPAAERLQRDEDIWHSLPPLNHCIAYKGAEKIPAVKGDWEPVDPRYLRDWYAPWRLVRREGKEIAEDYTWEDMAEYRTLPNTVDRGYGTIVATQEKGVEKPRVQSYIAMENWRRWRSQGKHLEELVGLYAQLSDRHAARDAVMLLARMAYDYPALRGVNFIVWSESKNPSWFGADNKGGRYFPSGWGIISLERLAGHYDKLFDFIDGNSELAKAVGRFIPWVRSPDDLRYLFDVYLTQNLVRDLTHFRRVTSSMTARRIINASIIQNDNAISRPWMEFLFSRSFEYPNALAGVDDTLVTSLTRDGANGIGSYFYCSPTGLGMATATKGYIENGGDPAYDLGDFTRYPKSLSGVHFGFESRIGGGFYPGIGDVGGPARPVNYHMAKVHSYADAGWALTHEPQFAWWQVNAVGRKGQSDEEWAAIEAAAAEVTISPLLNQRSRVLGEWFAALESGVGTPDFRFHRAVAVNVGNGRGHSHEDTMDLRIWALGANMSGDFGQRAAYGRPRHCATFSHNLVEVDGDGGYWNQNPGEWDGYAWSRTLFDSPGNPYTMVESTPPTNHPNVKLFRRQVALIDVDPGIPSPTAEPAMDPHVELPASYVFDVFRVSGGKRHTYCFHGCVDDNHFESGGFEVNVQNRQLMEELPEAEKLSAQQASDQAYLRNYRWGRECEGYTGRAPADIDKEWAADPAAEALRATWRMGDKAYERSLGGLGTVTGGRKHIRMHLFGVGNHRVLHGINTDTNGRNRLNPETPYYSGRCLYVQRTAEDDTDSAFAALLEPYAGEPTITESKLLGIPDNETDARRAVAVAVRTRYGTEDLLFADGRPSKARALPGGVTVAGEYAAVSRDAKGIRRATLVGGTQLSTPEISLRIDAPAYTGRIQEVDLLAGRVTVDGLPARSQLGGSFFEIGNDRHRSSYEITSLAAGEGAKTTVLQCRKGLEIMRATVLRIDYGTNRVFTNVAMHNYEGRNDGLVATNQRDRGKQWRVRLEGGNRFDGYTFILTGKDITPDDFRTGDKLSVWEFGTGDTVSLKTGVSLTRQPDGSWKVYANAPVEIGMAGKGLEWSADGKAWQAVTGAVGPGCPGVPTMSCSFLVRLRRLGGR